MKSNFALFLHLSAFLELPDFIVEDFFLTILSIEYGMEQKLKIAKTIFIFYSICNNFKRFVSL